MRFSVPVSTGKFRFCYQQLVDHYNTSKIWLYFNTTSRGERSGRSLRSSTSLYTKYSPEFADRSQEKRMFAARTSLASLYCKSVCGLIFGVKEYSSRAWAASATIVCLRSVCYSNAVMPRRHRIFQEEGWLVSYTLAA